MSWRGLFIRPVLTFIILLAFIANSLGPIPNAQAQAIRLPAPGAMIHPSPEFTPAHLVGMTIHPDNALQFDFLIHRGDDPLSNGQKRQEYTKLVKYFLASLTIPDEDQWVNLSPYEKNRIIKDDFGKTEMGRDLLAQDYILKQITSSLIYPEENLGKKFWDRIYQRAWSEYHTTNIPVNTFNKVWIIPDEAAVYESGDTVYVLRNHLKVMLEEDYLSLSRHSGSSVILSEAKNLKNDAHTIGSQVIREIVLPELEKEVNEGKNFANLRQIYSGMILATWYKRALKESLLGKIYANKAKVAGIVIPAKAGIQNRMNVNDIYQQYLQAFKKGVFNYIKEDVDKYTKESIPRKYFSGGAEHYHGAKFGFTGDPAELAILGKKDLATFSMNKLQKFESPADNSQKVDEVDTTLQTQQDAAMTTSLSNWPETQKAVDNLFMVLPKMNIFKRKALLKMVNADLDEIEKNVKFPGDIPVIVEKFAKKYNIEKDKGRTYPSKNEIINGTIYQLLIQVVNTKLYADIDGKYIKDIEQYMQFVNFVRDTVIFCLIIAGPSAISVDHIVVHHFSPFDLLSTILITIGIYLNIYEFKNLKSKVRGRISVTPAKGTNIQEKSNRFLKMYSSAALVGGSLGASASLVPIFLLDSLSKHLDQVLATTIIGVISGLYLAHRDIKQNDKAMSFTGGIKRNKTDAALVSLGELAVGLAIYGITYSVLFKKIPESIKKTVRLKSEYLLSPPKPSALHYVAFSGLYASVSLTAISADHYYRFNNVYLTDKEIFFSIIFGSIVGISFVKVFRPVERKNDKIKDEAISAPGGIDFDSAHLNLQIKRDGRGVPLPLSQQDMASLSQIDGFIPEITVIKPAMGLPIFKEISSSLRST